MAELEERPISPVSKPVIASPVAPSSLDEKLLTLASKLRSAGFEKQAEDLEYSFLTYVKTAADDASLLYRAHNETGEDLIDFAHPDGDVEMSPAKDHNGDVETIVSKHKKIVDLITGDSPKQTLASFDKAKVLAALKKTLAPKFADDIKPDPNGERKQELDSFLSTTKEITEKIPKVFKPLWDKTSESTASPYKTFLGGLMGGDSAGPSSPNKDVAKLNSLISDKDDIQLSLKNITDEGDEDSAINLYRKYSLYGQELDKKHAVWPVDALLKKCIAYCERLDPTPDPTGKLGLSPDHKPTAWTDGGVSIELHKEIAIIKAACYSLQHVWYAFWNNYVTHDKEAAKLHSQYLTPESIRRIFSGASSKMASVKTFINTGLMADPTISASDGMKAYLGKWVKIIDDAKANFDSIVNNAQKASVDKQSVFGPVGDIKAQDLKQFVTNPLLLKSLNFTDTESFQISLNSFYGRIESGLRSMITNEKALDNVRERMVSALNQSIGVN